MDFKNKKIAILGWGVDTQDVEPWLKSQEADVTVLDEKDKPFGDLTKYDILVRSPGVYRYRSDIVKAENAGTTVTSKTKIFFDLCPCPIIGVTGTKGKGTTSTLIYEILQRCLPAGRQVYLGGNIGKGVFEFLPSLAKDSLVVMELSSFQLIDLHKSPHIAVVLMTTSEHMDWHADPDEYIGAKTQITKFQNSKDFVVYNKDYPNSVKIGKQGKAKKISVSGKDWKGQMRLRGEHNRENIAAAVAVAKIFGIRYSVFGKVIKEFRGLEHRLEEVATINGVMYFDDSFSTTPETTIAAVKSFSETLILIVGGSEKGSDFTNLGKVISEAKNLKAVRIEKAILNKNLRIVRNLSNMPDIVKKVSELAKSGDVVLLSPAAASFDMFKNYKERGNRFKEEVKKLV